MINISEGNSIDLFFLTMRDWFLRWMKSIN
jgi:hypothetical protein